MVSSIVSYIQNDIQINSQIYLASYLIFDEDSYCDNSENDSDGRDANWDNGEN